MKRQAAEARGRQAERIAAWWLRLKGWRILDKRVRTGVGEIDLVARRGTIVAFVEVKARPSLDEAQAFLEPRAMRRIVAAAEALAPTYTADGHDTRIDAILVAPGPRVRHLENIWQGW